MAGRKGFSTTAIHHGDPEGNDIIAPIYQTAIFKHPGGKQIRGRDLKYSREDNPTVNLLEKKMAALEGGEDCLAFSSGMAAISTLLLCQTRSGDTIVTSKEIYGATLILMRSLDKFGIKVKCVLNDRIKEEIDEKTKLVFVESITNPTLNVPDLKGIAEVCRNKGATLVVDNTFATPINLRPIEVGADYVIHSATKYLCGHNDAIAGILVGPKDGIGALWEWRRNLGGNLDPFAAFLVIRGLKTLKLRLSEQNCKAQEIAEFLEGHAKVKRVHYPGLASSPSHKRAKELMSGFGGVVSFELKDMASALRFLGGLEIIKTAPSLGGAETLITHPASSSHKNISPEERAELGITDGLLRLSVGLEDKEDLFEDLEKGLAKS
ncbi:MAG: aminotransferase class I/II-fold pyridoxal phosphate-dependent enzyme [Candidatus Verstraetearchaeota archaeon]|nr:aminotransferase class I/II-fold pyridoxal phosphate-dependent enzyme [Candidatus Verstraetearchaeota archaeon]